ncbi:MAG: exo-alpha-sialidase [Clostridiales bacterium]|nr:exo-alpha-sialidase [Clostridiales bacterium]
MRITERFIAVDNGCLWPQLRIDNEGKIFLTAFNSPCHGMTEGDVDCWVSDDDGQIFKYQGTPVVHEPTTNRMNHVSGFAHNGDFLAIVSGYTNRPTIKYDYEYYKREYFYKSELVVPTLTRSSDEGKTYTVKPLDYVFENESIIPYGEIIKLKNNSLVASIYVLGTNKCDEFASCSRRAGIIISRNDGETWTEFYEIDEGINETSILMIDDNTMLASARTATNQHMKLYKSTDEGKTWTFIRDTSLLHQIPSSLIKLNDGHILMCYGVRNNQKSIMYRISEDNGESWTEPNILVVLDGAGDMGYPSSVQIEDGTIVTAYYADGITEHNRYHTGIVRWNL